MSKRLLPSIAILLIALAALLFYAFRPARVEKKVKVNFLALKAMDYLRDTRRIAKWMLPFAGSDTTSLSVTPQTIVKGDDTLRILHQGAVDINFHRAKGSQSIDFLIEGIPPLDSAYQTNMVLSYATTPWASWTGGDRLGQELQASLDSLGHYMSTPKKLYGYDIHEAKVTDSLFLFASKTIQREKFAEETKALYDMLISEAGKRKAGYNGVRIFHFEDQGNNMRAIYAGIGIDREVATPNDDIVHVKMMPAGKNLIVADYEGPYRGIVKVYEALEAYKSDNRFVSMAIPFHKYISDGYGFPDTAVVRMRVSYPVY